MSGNPFAKVTKGQRISIAAAAWNPLMDVAEREASRGSNGGSSGPTAFAGDRSIVRVYNNTGADVDRFAVLGIATAYITPTDNPADFLNFPVLSGVTPTNPGSVGQYAITLEPISKGVIGMCAVAGILPVSVSMVNATDSFAEIKDGDATQLQSGPTGSAQILYVESGTGTKQALVRLGIARRYECGEAVTVKVTGNASGGGKYTGRIMYTSNTTATGDLAELDIGILPSADNCLIVNNHEIGKSTHILTDTSNTSEFYFNGVVRAVQTDGTRVVAIDGFFGGCT